MVVTPSFLRRDVCREKALLKRAVTGGWGCLPESKYLDSYLLSSEANPEKFNSRFRNKMFYAGVSSLGNSCHEQLRITVNKQSLKYV